jgi:FkbM family methyltransferase
MKPYKSYSQLGEDIFLFQNFFNVRVDDAFIIEVGAYDGVTYSNTFFIEEYSGGRSILVEPSPISFRKALVNRPQSACYQLAISADYWVREFSGSSPVSGIISNMTSQYVERWGINKMNKYNVLTIPMNVLTDLECVKYIDFISIDVQGGEFDVLNTMDWTIPIYCICVELEGQNKGNDERCRELLRDNGFRFREKLHISEFWYRPDYFRADLLFDSKINSNISEFELLNFKPEWLERLKDKFI